VNISLTFGLFADERIGAGTDIRELPGMTAVDLQQLADEAAGAELSVRPGVVGKGGAAYGVELVLRIGEQAINDGASLFAWGSVLWAIVKRVQSHRERKLEVQDPIAISALATAANPANARRLMGAHLLKTVCLTGGGEGMGTDIRDVWATVFVVAGDDVLIVFSSPSGLILGEVTVPPEWTSARGKLDGAGAATVFARLNGLSEL
jgi:hypothetical protein